ncbi:MAG TPA: MarR family transcriptional regulator [Anaerolineaceae bacterium]
MNQNKFTNALLDWSAVFARRTIHDFLAFTHEHDISMPQVNVLMTLYYRGPTSIRTMRQELYGTRAAATQLVDKLVQLGLVKRSEAPDDRRLKLLTLTEPGRKLIEQGIAARRQWLSQLSASFTPEDQEVFASVLARLSQEARALEMREEQKGG